MNILNKEYEQLEKEIQTLTEKWFNELEGKSVTNQQETSSIRQYPILPQLSFSYDEIQYKSFILELLTLLKERQPALNIEVERLEKLVNEENVKNWFNEAVAVNEFYFNQFAKEHDLQEWLPYFVAEHALRPYLQKAAAELKDILNEGENFHGCPCCGEPPRLAVINSKGKKELTCPRCHYAWEEKKISCAYCGNEEPKTIRILKIEKDETAEIHVCEKCHGYTKVIDTRKMLRADAPQLLDIKSIHLDYIAQENGYGVPDIKESH